VAPITGVVVYQLCIGREVDVVSVVRVVRRPRVGSRPKRWPQRGRV